MLVRRIYYMNKYCSQRLSNFFLTYNNLISSCQWKFYSINKHDPTKIATAGTMQNVKQQLITTMGIEKGYKPMGTDRTHLRKYLPATQEELPPRTMNDSFVSAIIPLSTDFELQDKYVAFLGNARLGRLLEDMDLFACFVAQSHILNPKLPKGKPSPYTLVTVLVDRIDYTEYVPKPTEDIRLSGHVSWVGKSSLEVVVWLEQLSHGTAQKITRALFLMAARDPEAEKAAIINPLVATTDEEKQILANGETRKQQRIIVQSKQLTKVIPNADEQKVMHNLFLHTVDFREVSLKKRQLPGGAVWMDTCTLSNTIFSHPENRNLHNTVFGGFIMRQALELSWALGYLFTKHRPKLKSISDITFNRVVEVNTLVRMYAHIVFTYQQYFQCTVYIESYNARSGKNSTTGVFHFTYVVPEEVRKVFPHSYQEAMMYIDGRRHFYAVMTPESLKKKR